jgi:hypothetical protein
MRAVGGSMMVHWLAKNFGGLTAEKIFDVAKLHCVPHWSTELHVRERQLFLLAHLGYRHRR